MRRAAVNSVFILAIVFVPLLLGVLIVGGDPPIGRNTRSPTRVGHKAFFLLLDQLAYDVRRFERGLETLPDHPAVLIAVEPGPSLFRERGAFARNLLEWIARGNGALVTLGPDPDRSAELDDAGGELGEKTRQAIEIAETIRERAKERAASPEERPKPESEAAERIFQRAKRDASESWDSVDLTDFLGLALLEDRLSVSRTSTVALSGPMTAELAPGASLAVTRPRVFFQRREGGAREHRVLLAAGDRALLVEVPIGRGRLLLLSEPRVVQNSAIARGSHAPLAVRAVEHLAEVAGSNVVLFEEFSHGGREASTAIDLALTSRARWTVLQLLIVLLVGIAMVARRNRSLVPFEAPPRRSRDELIDALASLFLRANDTRGAVRRLIELSQRRLMGNMPAAAEAELVPLLATRLERDPQEIAATLDPANVAGARDLVERAEALRALRVAADAQK